MQLCFIVMHAYPERVSVRKDGKRTSEIGSKRNVYIYLYIHVVYTYIYRYENLFRVTRICLSRIQ